MPHFENRGPKFRFLIEIEVELVDSEKFAAAQLQEVEDQHGNDGIARIQEPDEWSVPRVAGMVIDYEALNDLGLRFLGSSSLPRMIDDNGNWAAMELPGYQSGPQTAH